MVQFYIGNLLDGRRIKILPDVLSGAWSEKLNAADALSCTVPLYDPVIKRMDLMNAATPAKTFLAAVSGDTVLAAGPIWKHEYQQTARGETLTLIAAGMWSYFDHRVLLPVLAGRLPSDPTTDTNLTKSLQGMARYYVEQAQSWTGGSVPVVLPTEIAGTNVRNEAGSSLALVGNRLRDLTQVIGGPDIKFAPRFNSAHDGFQWDMLIGTPTQPLIYGAVRPTFNVGLPESSVSNLRVTLDGAGMNSQSFASGGRISGEVLIATATNSTLPDAGYPLLESVDQSRLTVSELTTVQGYADELVLAGKTPTMSMSFDHQVTKQPFLSGFNVGDFANVVVRDNGYLHDGRYTFRITARSGNEVTRVVSLVLEPEVI